MKIYPVTLMLKATLMTNSVIDAIPVFFMFLTYMPNLVCFVFNILFCKGYYLILTWIVHILKKYFICKISNVKL